MTPGPTPAAPAKKSSVGLVIGLIVGLFAVGGVAYGLYWYFGSASPVLAKYMPKDTQAYFELPSVTKALAKTFGADVIDSSEIDTDKQIDNAVEGLTEAFDGLKKDDARELIKSVNGIAMGMRDLKSDKEGCVMFSFSSADPVEALLKTDRFSKSDKIAGGQGYELESKKDIDFDRKFKLTERMFMGKTIQGDKNVLVWFSEQKILVAGDHDFVEDAGKLITGAKDESLAGVDSFKSAKFESGSVALGWIDSDAIDTKDDDKLADAKKKFFQGVGPFVFSGRVASGGMVLTFTGDLKGKGIPDEKLVPEGGKMTLQEKLPANTLAYLAVANSKKLEAKEAKNLLVDFVKQIDKEDGKEFETKLDDMDDHLGVTFETLNDAFAGSMGFPKEEVFAIVASDKLKFEKEDLEVDSLLDHVGGEFIIRVNDADAAAKVLKAIREKGFEEGPGKDLFDIDKKDDGFLASPKKDEWPMVRVAQRDDCIFLMVGRKKRIDEMLDAFDGKTDSLKSQKHHKLAIGSLDTKPVALFWADTGRVMKGMLDADDKIKDGLKEEGVPYKALRLEGEERVTTAVAIELTYKDEGIHYRVESLNALAVAPISALYLGRMFGGFAKKVDKTVDTDIDFDKPNKKRPDPIPSSGSGGGTGGPIGIDECDEYFRIVDKCKGPVGDALRQNNEQMKDSLKQSASFATDPSVRKSLVDACKQMVDSVKTSCN